MFNRRALAICIVTLGLAACGGSGGGSNEPSPPPPQANPEGFWSGTLSTGDSLEALVTETGEIWAIGISNGSVVSMLWGKGETSGSTYQGTGFEYYGGAVGRGSFSAEVETRASLIGSAGTVQFKLQYNDSYEIPASQVTLAGKWATFDRSALFEIDATGSVSGTMSTADTGYQPCSFSGNAKAHDSKNYYKVNLTLSDDMGCQPRMGASYQGVLIKDYGGITDTLLIGAARNDNTDAFVTIAFPD